ncbi:methyl-accepting chemotaxis protein [Paenibacillus sp. TRM 82003]|nr:methyl-accepting chemotaxis protein [Paenibacillus sp. TRM 82003]
MQRRFGIKAKITLLTVSAVLFSVLSILAVGYQVNFRQVDAAAGEELVGCASITSGLVSPADIAALAAGDATSLAKVESSINWILEHKSIFKNASVMAFDGTLLAVDRQLKAQGFQAGDKFYVEEDAVAMVREMKHTAYTELYTFGGAERKTGYAPIFEDHDPSKPVIAMMAIDFDGSIVHERTWDMMLFTLRIGGVFPLLAAVAAYFVAGRLARPIEDVTRHVRTIASGDLRLDDLRAHSRDEIGELSGGVNEMTAQLRTMLADMNEAAAELATAAEKMNERTGESAEAAARTAEAALGIAEGARGQERSTQETAVAMEEMASGVSRVADACASAAGLAGEASARTAEGAAAAAGVETRMTELTSAFEAASERMRELSERTRDITRMNEAIEEIATQTNLLALNASIEAARAGEAGGGFAVVAGEVMKLAAQTTASAREIARLSEAVRTTTERTEAAMADSASELAAGRSTVAELRERFAETLRGTDTVSAHLLDISAVAEQMSAGTQQVAASFAEITLLASRSASSAGVAGDLAARQQEAMKELSDAAQRLTALSRRLSRSAQSFRTA